MAVVRLVKSVSASCLDWARRGPSTNSGNRSRSAVMKICVGFPTIVELIGELLEIVPKLSALPSVMVAQRM